MERHLEACSGIPTAAGPVVGRTNKPIKIRSHIVGNRQFTVLSKILNYERSRKFKTTFKVHRTRSLKVIGNLTIRWRTYDFILLLLCNSVSVLSCCRHTRNVTASDVEQDFECDMMIIRPTAYVVANHRGYICYIFCIFYCGYIFKKCTFKKLTLVDI